MARRHAINYITLSKDKRDRIDQTTGQSPPPDRIHARSHLRHDERFNRPQADCGLFTGKDQSDGAGWDGLKEIAKERRRTLDSLVQEVDRKRGDSNFSSAVRVYILNYYCLEGHPAARRSTA